MLHKLNKIKFDEKQQARKDLALAHTPPTSVQDLKERLDNIEIIIGI